MSGHSKWATIKRKKGAIDAKRGKMFTKIGRELAVAVREGGADSSSNGKLRDAIAKAKANNMPNETIQRSIKKAAGESGGSDYINMIYEGYGPGGVAVIVETLSDNKNRTAGDLRHYFDKCGGNLGQTGCVGFMFDRKGIIVIENDTNIEEDAIIDDALEAGADDVNIENEFIEVITSPEKFSFAREKMEEMGYDFTQAEINYIPQTMTELTSGDDVKKMERLIEMLEDNDDVQNVYHSWNIPD